MEHYGIKMLGYFIVEKVSTLPAWESDDKGREIYTLDTNKRYYGDESEWVNYSNLSSKLMSIKTEDYTIDIDDFSANTVFTNTSASGSVNITLISGTNNYNASMYISDNEYMKFTAVNSQTIRFSDTQSSGNGYVRSNTIGNFIEMLWTGTEWSIVNIVGEWTIDD